MGTIGITFFAIFLIITVLFIIACCVGLYTYDHEQQGDMDIYVLVMLLSGGLMSFLVGLSMFIRNQ